MYGCLEQGLTTAEVEQNTRQAKQIGIRGTPTVVLQDRAYANSDWNTLQGMLSEGR